MQTRSLCWGSWRRKHSLPRGATASGDDEFIYSRKSSEDDDRQALSIAAQLSELNSIASRESLSIAAAHRNAPTWSDSRNSHLRKTYLPSDNVLSIAVELGMANQYVRDPSLNTRRGIREKVRRGIFSGTAPLGSFDEPRLRTIEPHPKQFKKLKAIFEEFAEGNQTLADVLRSLNKAGFVGRQNGKPLTYSTIGKILRNPFYCGLFLHKGELHQGIHLPMITKAFDRIQETLLDVGKPQNGYHRQKGFLFLDFATCSSCGYSNS
jgi:DNA invertase Pin-like site-specific DNA recombinase